MIAEFFKEADGRLSAMRLNSFIALLVAIALSFTGTGIDVISLWIVAAFVPKTVQKFAEKK